jgi:hypothetical protein
MSAGHSPAPVVNIFVPVIIDRSQPEPSCPRIDDEERDCIICGIGCTRSDQDVRPPGEGAATVDDAAVLRGAEAGVHGRGGGLRIRIGECGGEDRTAFGDGRQQ